MRYIKRKQKVDMLFKWISEMNLKQIEEAGEALFKIYCYRQVGEHLDIKCCICGERKISTRCYDCIMKECKEALKRGNNICPKCKKEIRHLYNPQTGKGDGRECDCAKRGEKEDDLL